MKGVAPNGSMLASSILLIMELPAIEAARPALKPAHAMNKHTTTQAHTQRCVGHRMGARQRAAARELPVEKASGCVFTRADDACVEHGEVLLAGGEGGDAEGATGLGAPAHPPLRWGTGTFRR